MINVPKIGIGVGGYDYETTYNSVLKALKIGYRLIDTAENYNNEDAVGNAIVDSGIDRRDIILISKYFGGDNYGKRDDVRNSFNNSLKKLRTNYIDIYLVHTPFGCMFVNEWEPICDDKFINYKKRISVWLEFVELKKQNLVHYIGVSNWTLNNMNEIIMNNLNVPDIIEIECSPLFYEKQIFDYCTDNSIKIIGYGLFSRNAIDEIKNIELSEKNKSKSEILLKWCFQKNIISIPRSNNFENLVSNFNACSETWRLCDADIILLDNIPKKSKGHCLEKVYAKNCDTNIWKPLIVKNLQSEKNVSDDKINDLINGNISCIIVDNTITNDKCINILKKMEDANLLKNQLPYDNYGIHFRGNEIGITIDNMDWRYNPDGYFNECTKVNKLFENIFSDISIINPFDILYETILKVVGNKYVIKRMKNFNNIECPIGVFRFFSSNSVAFPYHTDGFNYGNFLNNLTNLDKNLYPMIMNSDTNSVIAIILVLQQTNNTMEVDLHNCIVDELEPSKDETGMYSHWMGTKYMNDDAIKNKLQDKPFFSPILNTGDLYIFSASRIHKLNNFIDNNKNRIVLATFGCVEKNEIILYQ